MPYRSIEDPAKLRRVIEAVLLLERERDLPALLRNIIEQARAMTNARYAALGVLNDEGTALAEFITVGLEPGEEEEIGPRPTGKGVLGLLITEPKPLRVRELESDPQSAGFPPNHPPMTSFLGVPVKLRDRVYGNLYLTDKIGWSEFTGDDEALVGALALGAGIAIENHRLHERAQQAAVFEDRERLARDLHDAVIQRLFAVGLNLQSLASHPSTPETGDRLRQAVHDIDETIRQVRTSIFELGLDEQQLESLRARVLALLEELRPVVGFDVRPTFAGPIDTAVPETVTEHLLAVLREAVTNIGRHAEATRASVAVSVGDGEVVVVVTDDGRGISPDAARSGGGLGLVNLQRRAEKLRGSFTAESPEPGGTVLTWRVPIDS